MPTCELCGKGRFELIATKIREGDGRISKCSECGLVIQELDWNADKLRQYYEDEYQMTNSLVTGMRQSVKKHYNDRMKTIDSVYERIAPLLHKGSRVLEVGCGDGSLLSKMKPHVSRCVGVEIHTPFVDFIKESLKIEAYADDVNKLKIDEEFDLVISISTLDHLSNPLETLSSMKRLLAPKGRIYIEVPNVEEGLNCNLPEINRKRYNEFFWHRAHLFYFSKETAQKLFEKAGLKVDISCRHEYTLKNFLNWYFMGRPQTDFVTGLTNRELFDGKDEFEDRMNVMFCDMDYRFKQIMAEEFKGDNLCCVGYL